MRSWPRWSNGTRPPPGSLFSSRRRIRSSCASPKSRCAFSTRLVDNCRNTVHIAEYAAGLIGTQAHVKAGAPQGQPVEVVTCADGGEVVRQVTAKLDQLVLRENVDPDQIAIVSTRRLGNSPFARNHRAGCFELVNLDERERPSSTGSRRVVFDTLHRFKGLERNVVILLDLSEGEFSGVARPASSGSDPSHITASHRYVAASRARNLLIVVHLDPEAPS